MLKLMKKTLKFLMKEDNLSWLFLMSQNKRERK